MSKKDCESCARWKQAAFRSLFVRCPECGRKRDEHATSERDRRAEIARQAEVKAYKQSDTYGRVIQAILDVYDDYVSQHGPNAKHVFFIVTYKAVAARLNTTTYQVRKALLGGVNFEEVLVKHGRGFFWRSGPPHHFRHFSGFATEDHEREVRLVQEWATRTFYTKPPVTKCA